MTRATVGSGQKTDCFGVSIPKLSIVAVGAPTKVNMSIQPEGTISVLLVDDHAVFRHAIKSMLEKEGPIKIIGECSSGHEAIDFCQKHQFDVLLLDYSLEDMTAPQIAESVLKAKPDLPIVVLTMHDEPLFLEDLVNIGVKAYVLKKSDSSELFRAIQAAHRNKTYIDPYFAAQKGQSIPDEKSDHRLQIVRKLTKREKEILNFLVFGFTSAEISNSLSISNRTVERHRANIMAKLDLKGRAELVQFALENRLVDLQTMNKLNSYAPQK